VNSSHFIAYRSPTVSSAPNGGLSNAEEIHQIVVAHNEGNIETVRQKLRTALNNGNTPTVISALQICNITELDLSEPGLKTLDESTLKLSKNGVATLASLLQKGTIQLEKLVLGHVESMQPFTDALPNFPSNSPLKSLDLRNLIVVPPHMKISCRLEQRHTDKIVEFLSKLPQSSHFQELLIRSNLLPDDARKELEEIGQKLTGRVDVKIVDPNAQAVQATPTIQAVKTMPALTDAEKKKACVHLLNLLNGGEVDQFKAALNHPSYRITELDLNIDGAFLSAKGATALGNALLDHSLPIKKIILGFSEDLSPVLSELRSFNLDELDMTRLCVEVESGNWSWTRRLTQEHVSQLYTVAVSLNGSLPLKTVIGLDSRDFGTEEDKNREILQKLRATGMVSIIDIFTPKSALTILYEKLNGGEQSYLSTIDLVSDKEQDAHLRLTERGMQTFAYQQKYSVWKLDGLKLGRVETLDPLLKLHGGNLPKMLDLSKTKICRMENDVLTEQPLSDEHGQALIEQILQGRNSIGGLTLKSLHIDVRGMSKDVVDRLRHVCNSEPKVTLRIVGE
jgi:hypothetical protein